MRVLVTLEDHLQRTSDGHVYGNGPGGYLTWSELLDTFDEVFLLSRVGRSNDLSLKESRNRFDGPSIFVHDLPDYTGPLEYLLKVPSLRIGVRQAVAQCDVYLLRAPGLISRLAWQEIRSVKGTYAVQLVGDPVDTLGVGSFHSPFRRIYQQVAIRDLRKTCEQANAVLYCTRRSLQRRYPPGEGAYSASSPWVILTQGYASSQQMADRRRRIDEVVMQGRNHLRPFRFGFIGSFAQLYKGADTLLRAAVICSQNGLDFKIFFVGEGRYRSEMQSLVTELSIQDKVSFIGQMNFGKPIFDFLDSLDLYLMPSRAEAFGRALLEAMARGCPCIGSNVGGIPELLAPEDLVPPSDPKALAQKIIEVTADPQRMKEMSERNLARAKQFDPEVLRDARLAFYRYIRDHSGGNAKSGREQQSTLQPL